MKYFKLCTKDTTELFNTNKQTNKHPMISEELLTPGRWWEVEPGLGLKAEPPCDLLWSHGGVQEDTSFVSSSRLLQINRLITDTEDGCGPPAR